MWIAPLDVNVSCAKWGDQLFWLGLFQFLNYMAQPVFWLGLFQFLNYVAQPVFRLGLFQFLTL